MDEGQVSHISFLKLKYDGREQTMHAAPLKYGLSDGQSVRLRLYCGTEYMKLLACWMLLFLPLTLFDLTMQLLVLVSKIRLVEQS